ncbi:signal peptidase I [Enterobacteriaceae endosymbiont of Donacia tomentosa]|uniref:signal peptidase I n=1 Tax=Enterobacteriaceae endosymbiont of Donacia tomentosa TaxID=2675787 RepID=UPI0014497601|nr:signal peptidase I [Enterobacteriaceae endosymbiont of Donacia tomentosa]QJC31615.1 signal peptidase I [Enterobacteriaceae endosymbiont of Donacia tomentosa]
MNNIYTKILILCIFITGCLWFFYKIRILNNFILNKKINNLYYKNFSIKEKNSWKEEISSLFPFILLIFLVRSFLYEPFYIPSGSMMPTLLIGDFILVNKFIYGIKNPINNKIIIDNKLPKRGDVVVFQYPKNIKVNFIKRIIGLPGDKIIYNIKNKQIILIVKKNNKKNINKTSIKYSKLKKSSFIQTFQILNKISGNNFYQKSIKSSFFGGLRFFEYIEKIDQLSHKIIFLPEIINESLKIYRQKNQSIYTWIVPKESYFVMGDNRDDSYDSRYWGFVDKKYLLGKAVFIWLSIDKKINHLPKIRFNRIHWIN